MEADAGVRIKDATRIALRLQTFDADRVDRAAAGVPRDGGDEQAPDRVSAQRL